MTTALFRTVPYGTDPSQVGDLYLPGALRPPVLCLLHGGFWRMPYGRDQMAPLAADLVARGYAVWNLEYRRTGGGGGWPQTFLDVAAGIDHLAALAAEGPELDLGRVITLGHSAGGQLALWAAGRHRLPPEAPGAGPRVRVAAAIGQAPAADLVAAHAYPASKEPVLALLGGPPSACPERYRAASPRALLPFGVPHLLVHGADDDLVPVAMSRDYATTAQEAGEAVAYAELPGTGHFEHLDPNGAAWAAVRAWLEVTVISPGGA